MNSAVTNMPPVPTVTAVVATKDRPDLLRRTLRSILAQDYPGLLEVVVVFDQDTIDPLEDIDQAAQGRVRLRRVRNARTPGLAGGRNTGIALASGDLVAFCDDDDEWLPGKLSAQVALLHRRPDAGAISSGITIVTGKRRHDRVPAAVTSRSDFLRSRVAEVHTSSLLVRRRDVMTPNGFVDEQLPASYGEDYDILLRLSELGDVHSVTSPQVLVHWNRPSFFAERWQGLAAGLSYLLRKHPDLVRHHRNAARIRGQIAFAHAAAGDRAAAGTWARRSMGTRRGEPRAWAALAVAGGVLSPGLMVRAMNKLGKGL